MTWLFLTTPPLGMRHLLSLGCLSREEANQSLSILLPSPGFQISQVLREEYNWSPTVLKELVVTTNLRLKLLHLFHFQVKDNNEKSLFLISLWLGHMPQVYHTPPNHHQGVLDFLYNCGRWQRPPELSEFLGQIITVSALNCVLTTAWILALTIMQE